MPESPCCCSAELAALLKLNGGLELTGSTNMTLYVTTENAGIARKVFKLFKQLFEMPVTVIIERKKRFRTSKVYGVKAHLNRKHVQVLRALGIMDSDHNLVVGIAPTIIKNRCCKRAYLRGAFLARGSVNRPEGEYHLEMIIPTHEMAVSLQKAAESLGVKFRLTQRKNMEVLYLKEADLIVDFLRLIGASYALLEFEDVRIYKSMKNNINRQVNCETANLEKTLDASLRQTEIIRKLVNVVGMEGIPAHLREPAMLRLEHPDYSLKELGELMNPPLSKSGFAYRMKKLESLADSLL